jgi:hypothetical protein
MKWPWERDKERRVAAKRKVQDREELLRGQAVIRAQLKVLEIALEDSQKAVSTITKELSE